TNELGPQRIELLSGFMIDVQVQRSRQRVFVVAGLFRFGGNEVRLRIGGERNGAQVFRPEADAAITDCVLVVRNGYNRGTARLFFELFAEVAMEQGILLEKAVRSGGGVWAIVHDRLVHPLSLQARIAPRIDRLWVAALAVTGEYGVHLLERQP